MTPMSDEEALEAIGCLTPMMGYLVPLALVAAVVANFATGKAYLPSRYSSFVLTLGSAPLAFVGIVMVKLSFAVGLFSFHVLQTLRKLCWLGQILVVCSVVTAACGLVMTIVGILLR